MLISINICFLNHFSNFVIRENQTNAFQNKFYLGRWHKTISILKWKLINFKSLFCMGKVKNSGFINFWVNKLLSYGNPPPFFGLFMSSLISELIYSLIFSLAGILILILSLWSVWQVFQFSHCISAKLCHVVILLCRHTVSLVLVMLVPESDICSDFDLN